MPGDDEPDADVERTRLVWNQLGERDPMWAVLSSPDKIGGRWDVDEFFASGEAQVSTLVGRLDAAGALPHTDRALDFGCGLGRLTLPLADHFTRVDGVDVAASMIEQARRHNTRGERCTFHLNERSDLARFDDDSFDLVLSLVVLQHIPPALTKRYLAEFVRVAKPGGTIVFQLPSEHRSPGAAAPLPPEARRARIDAVASIPTVVEPRSRIDVAVELENRSQLVWPALVDDQEEGQLVVASRWLSARGRMRVPDAGRAALPRDLAPGEACVVHVPVLVPPEAGRIELEVDVLQDGVGWFGESGSHALRAPVQVRACAGSRFRALIAGPVGLVRRSPVLSRMARLAPRPHARSASSSTAPIADDEMFDMNVVPRADVTAVLHEAGADIVEAHEDGAAGPAFVSYRYLVRKRDT